jgi:hypothetical protein
VFPRGWTRLRVALLQGASAAGSVHVHGREPVAGPSSPPSSWFSDRMDWPTARPRVPDISALVAGRLPNPDWPFRGLSHPLPPAPTCRESRELISGATSGPRTWVAQGLEGGVRTGVMGIGLGWLARDSVTAYPAPWYNYVAVRSFCRCLLLIS